MPLTGYLLCPGKTEFTDKKVRKIGHSGFAHNTGKEILRYSSINRMLVVERGNTYRFKILISASKFDLGHLRPITEKLISQLGAVLCHGKGGYLGVDGGLFCLRPWFSTYQT